MQTLGLTKNSVFRLLATLESRNYVVQNKLRGAYRLGYRNLQLGHSVTKQMPIHTHARPVLQSLTESCGETSELSILWEGQALYLDAIESSHPLRAIPRIGSVPLYCTAVGKVLLAGDREARQRNCCSIIDFSRYTPNTITDRQDLNTHLELVATQGYAIEDEELDVGLRAVAAPIRNHTGFVVAAISLSGPSTRFDKSRMSNELAPLVINAAKSISERLGYHPAETAIADSTHEKFTSTSRHEFV